MRQTTRTRWLGFSLVELMAVVTVVGILVALALPRFRIFIARGRQGEAIQNLGAIHKLQKAFHLREQGFGNDGQYHSALNMGLPPTGMCDDSAAGTKNTLGFRVPECDDLRYTYTSDAGDDKAENDGLGTHYIYPSCGAGGSTDTWTMSKAGQLSNDSDIVEHCDG